MTAAEIARKRLMQQHLITPVDADPVQIVSALGAVQAQDFPNAKWAIAQRTTELTEAAVARAADLGDIVRTHVLRPTWHLVASRDLRWMLELTAPRVKTANASWYRNKELDAATFRKSHRALTKALEGGNQLTRAELAKALGRAGLDVSSGQRVAGILMQAELDALICSGAQRGKHATYALFDERIPAAPARDREEALFDLARRYFTTRGPATLQDFSWWSGLTIADAKRAVESTDHLLESMERDGRKFWFQADSSVPTRKSRTAHLLPNYDEFFVGFKDRSAIAERLRKSVTNARVDALMGHVLVVDGQIVGSWRRSLGKALDLEIELLVALNAVERKLVLAAVERFGQFFGVPVKLSGLPR